jgi:beta-glucosidase
MRSVTFLFAMLAANIFAAPLNLTGTVKDENGNLENAVVLLKMNDELIAYARTLSKADGTFALLPGKDAPGEISTPSSSSSSSDGNPSLSSSSDVVSPILQSKAMQFANVDNYQVADLRGRIHKPTNLPQGVYVVLGKVVYHKGGNLILNSQLNSKKPLPKVITTAGEAHLIVRKAGYLPKEVEINSFSQNVGNVVLERDPLEARIDNIMATMSLDNKIYQMNQVVFSLNNFGVSGNLYGSVLHGGDTYSSTVLSSMRTALNSASYSVKIPVTYGKDMMHGAAAISGATIFPHNIGMGATRDSALVRKACEVTAKESWAGNVDLIFGPAISVPQDERWGRTYEGFGETAELAVQMGAACIRGYQGSNNNADWRGIATAKHY